MTALAPFVLDPKYQPVADGREPYTFKERKAQQGCMGGFIVLLVVSLLCTFGFITSLLVTTWSEWSQLSSSGLQIQGTVIEKTIDDNGDSTTYSVIYRFTHIPPDGDPRDFSDSDTVDSQFYDEAEIGGPVTIWYATSDPTVSQIGAPNIWFVLFLTIVLGGGGLLVNGALIGGIINLRRTLQKGHRLAAPGALLVRGTITSIKGEVDDDSFKVTVEYAFQSPTTALTLSGSKLMTRDDLMREDGHHLPPVGTSVVVAYADDRMFEML